MVIRRIGVGSVAKIAGLLYAVAGFLIGACFALAAMVGAGIGAASSDESAPLWLAPLFGVGAIVILPILYGLLGAVFASLGAVVYNVVAGMVGGLRVEVE
jgi:hypothetical protein